MEKVFVYGTLQDEKLRQQLTGRPIGISAFAELKEYGMSTVFDDGNSYPIIYKTANMADNIRGQLIEVSEKELAILDEYEGSLYRRIKVELNSGEQAWAYVE
ncbi:MAG: gamma-glutamylcyclotransferase [Bacteroidales bacterium]|nr:gamma-glutamylcyclotransferase [Bacteroidales bacterium]MBN2820464.1 gamma-glutamylcyclotransferase [Bacteroidales bacterium]